VDTDAIPGLIKALRALPLAVLSLGAADVEGVECGVFRLFPTSDSDPSIFATSEEPLTLLRGVSWNESAALHYGMRLSLPAIEGGSALAPSPAAQPLTPAKTGSLLRTIRPYATLFIAGTTIGYAWGNSQDEIPFHGTFHFTAEGFFGQNTYAGGADKASHLVDYAVAYRALEFTYRRIGYADSQSQWLGFATALAAGLTTEIGDGTTIFGFSWEDFTMDFLGAFSAMSLQRSGWDDTFGFRYGAVSQDPAPACCIDNSNIGRDYSGEIYTADIKLAGLARRWKFDPGPARYLLLSLTYGTNGYNHASPELRQRLVGLEIGIHFSEILRALGVPKEPIWGELIYFFFDTIRLPYTAIGVRFDLNHNKWFFTTGRTPFRVPTTH